MYSERLQECADVFFSFDLKNCQNCIFSSNLRNKSYCIDNVQYTKEEFEKRLKEELTEIVKGDPYNNALKQVRTNYKKYLEEN